MLCLLTNDVWAAEKSQSCLGASSMLGGGRLSERAAAFYEGTYRRDHLRALAHASRSSPSEIRIMGTKTEL